MRRHVITGLRWIVLWGILALAWVTLRGWAFAQDHAADAPRARLRPQTALLAFEVARVAMNEAMGAEADLALIWQTVEGRAEGTPGRRAWLRAHSRCVAGLLPEAAVLRRRGPCRWTRELTPEARRPSSWDDERDGSWSRMRTRWLATLRRSMRHAAGDRLPIVCPSAPRTWDGRRWMAAARARGFVALGCKGTRNAGLRRAQ